MRGYPYSWSVWRSYCYSYSFHYNYCDSVDSPYDLQRITFLNKTESSQIKRKKNNFCVCVFSCFGQKHNVRLSNLHVHCVAYRLASSN